MARPIEVRRLLGGCDDEQIAAITSEASPLLVLAGAGSGKTRVLTHRIAYRVATGSASPAHVLALTFTRKAATELRERLRRLGLSCSLTAGTFHAVALAELRRQALDEGRSAPAVLDSKARLLAAVIPEHTTAGTARFERSELLRMVASEIEWARARRIEPGDYGFAATNARRRVGIDVERVAGFYASYEAEKKKHHVMDFDDLLERLAVLIEQNPSFAAVERWRFRHLFVDELQDANPAQLRLLDALIGPDSDLFAVGDARQAIYGWNGADPSGVTEFATRYRGASVLELSTNYRSTPEIVAVADSMLDAAAKGAQEPARANGKVPVLSAYANDNDEAVAVCEAIRHLRRTGKAYRDIAVLARTNAQLEVFKELLGVAGVPARAPAGPKGASVAGRALRLLGGARDPEGFARLVADLEEDLAENETGSGEHRSETTELKGVLGLAREYLQADARPNGEGFRAYVRSDSFEVEDDAVSLLSFHRAKGLQWRVVFVVGLEEGYVPIAHASSRAAVLEERRLLYVALSRAEDELYCSYAGERRFAGRLQRRNPSPYLAELEAACAALGEVAPPERSVVERALKESRAALGERESSSRRS